MDSFIKENNDFIGLDDAMRTVAATKTPVDLIIPHHTGSPAFPDIDVTAHGGAVISATSPIGHDTPLDPNGTCSFTEGKPGFTAPGKPIPDSNGMLGISSPCYTPSLSSPFVPQGQINAYAPFGITLTSFLPSEENPFITTNGYIFYYNTQGLHAIAPTKDAPDVHIISWIPVITDLTNEQCIVIAKQVQTGFRSITLMIDDIINNQKRLKKIMARNGFTLKAHPRAAHLFQVFLQEAPAAAIALGVTRSGWHQQYGRWHFVLPWFTASPAGCPAPVYLGVGGSPSPMLSATLDAWRQNVSIHCRGNSRLVFAIAFALSATLFREFGLKGCILHFFAPSTTGKSSIQEVTASLFPGGREKFYKTWRATANGMEDRLMDYNDCAVVFDEIAEMSPRDLYDLIYIIGNGAGKLRKTDRERHPATDMRVGVISSGEMSICSHLASGGYTQTGGQVVRAIDLPAVPDMGYGVFEKIPAGFTPAQFAEHLTIASRNTSGSVLPAFLDAVIRDTPRALSKIDEYRQRFLQQALPIELDAQARRVSQYFSLAAAVGEFATEIGILPFDKGESFRATQTCFQAWFDHYRENTMSESDRIRERLSMILRRYGESGFLPYHGRKSTELGKVYGYRQTLGAQTDYILPKEGFERMFSGFDPGLVRKELNRMGMLQTAGRDLQVSRTLPGSGSTKCTVLRIGSDQYALPGQVIDPHPL